MIYSQQDGASQDFPHLTVKDMLAASVSVARMQPKASSAVWCFVYVFYPHTLLNCLLRSCFFSFSLSLSLSRNLGVHISKVRSITLDEWEPEIQMVRKLIALLYIDCTLDMNIYVHVYTCTCNLLY